MAEAPVLLNAIMVIRLPSLGEVTDARVTLWHAREGDADAMYYELAYKKRDVEHTVSITAEDFNAFLSAKSWSAHHTSSADDMNASNVSQTEKPSSG